MLEQKLQEVILHLTMLRSPHLAEAVTLAALLFFLSFFFSAIRTCFSLTDDGTLKKIGPSGYVYRCKHSCLVS